MAPFSAASASGPESSEPTKMPLIPYESNIPQLREIYQCNQSSFIHRFPPEIRNMIMEYCVAVEADVEPERELIYPWGIETKGNSEIPVNTFVWGNYEKRSGTIDGDTVEHLIPTTGPLAVVSLRLTCRQFYHELEGVFYRVNNFMFPHACACEDYLANLTIQRRRQIRSISLNLSFSGTDFVSPTTTPETELEFLARKVHPLAKLLMVNCPSLKRLTVHLGERARLFSTFLEPHRYTGTIEFEDQRSRLHFEQRNRNPARVYAEMTGYFGGLEHTINDLMRKRSPLAHPKLEFFIGGSPTIFARVDGRPIHRSSADAPGYIREFEDKLEKANEKMHEFHQAWPDPQIDEFLSDPKHYKGLLLGESTRMQQAPVPDLKNFRLDVPNQYDLLCDAGEVVSGASRYDSNGLLLWQNIPRPHVIIDILWKGEEIVCGIILGPGRRDVSFESVSRFASWCGVSRICDYFRYWLDPDRQRYYVRHRRRQLRILTENPSPKDIDAALRATGFLRDDEAPADIHQAWSDYINTQEGYIARLNNEVDWSIPFSFY
ncbi:hypothetical protein GGR55DRAFT_704045 [Xylaria sp. FL0064]|nr:hypothetical protein GGR55DRAFT_704045 [Xylaria sp. FL0064]